MGALGVAGRGGPSPEYDQVLQNAGGSEVVGVPGILVDSASLGRCPQCPFGVGKDPIPTSSAGTVPWMHSEQVVSLSHSQRLSERSHDVRRVGGG